MFFTKLTKTLNDYNNLLLVNDYKYNHKNCCIDNIDKTLGECNYIRFNKCPCTTYLPKFCLRTSYLGIPYLFILIRSLRLLYVDSVVSLLSFYE